MIKQKLFKIVDWFDSSSVVNNAGIKKIPQKRKKKKKKGEDFLQSR